MKDEISDAELTTTRRLAGHNKDRERARFPLGRPAPTTPRIGQQAFLDNLIRARLLTQSIVSDFLAQQIGKLGERASAKALGEALVEAALLTSYQVERLMNGTAHGLVLGNYRVLSRLGSGGMGDVYRAEHIFLQRQAAVKVLPMDDNCSSELLNRFYTEMRVLAELHHPNIVMAYDGGCCTPESPGLPTLIYLAMEFVDGWNLEEYVKKHGRPSVAQACTWASQAASRLQHAHDHKLIHRDIKPSNLLLARSGTVKLGDFGLVRQFASRLTNPNTLLGTVGFMPPEQSLDPSSVGSYADMYGLGATLFWLLTNEYPYRMGNSVRECLNILQTCQPRHLRDFRPDIPVELERIVQGLIDPNPTHRPAMPLTLMKALSPFTGERPS